MIFLASPLPLEKEPLENYLSRSIVILNLLDSFLLKLLFYSCILNAASLRSLSLGDSSILGSESKFRALDCEASILVKVFFCLSMGVSSPGIVLFLNFECPVKHALYFYAAIPALITSSKPRFTFGESKNGVVWSRESAGSLPTSIVFRTLFPTIISLILTPSTETN